MNIYIFIPGFLALVWCSSVLNADPIHRQQPEFNLKPLNHQLNQLHLKTLYFFNEEKRISLLNLRSAYNKSLTELGRFIDQVQHNTKNAEEYLENKKILLKLVNATCTSTFADNRASISDFALKEETKCAVNARARMQSTVNSFFYSFHDEALRQSTQSQWLVISTLGRYNMITQQDIIREELEDIIWFSEVMWNGTKENVLNEVRYVDVEVEKDVQDLERCCSDVFGTFDATLKWNVCQSLKC